ncbi:hypothetical protein BT96DRAFT_925276 [Gymnopus androsaceus JB14]|uniref:Uncharacterized protein n=1 Tax=Gymnopus androsaceus JB14 TaxID=1447944 RepID=A0A6A4GZY5_9AGAR|nr:hypothetical protein BT96DRAFT_925276 [Gymnopus androsaceus JB14]
MGMGRPTRPTRPTTPGCSGGWSIDTDHHDEPPLQAPTVIFTLPRNNAEPFCLAVVPLISNSQRKGGRRAWIFVLFAFCLVLGWIVFGVCLFQSDRSFVNVLRRCCGFRVGWGILTVALIPLTSVSAKELDL